MSTLKTFRLYFEPDAEFPAFERLASEPIDVSLRDVLVHGVHPWTDQQGAVDQHPTLVEALLARINDGSAKVPELEPAGYSADVTPATGMYYQNKSRFLHTLEYLNKFMYFVDDLPYLKLLAMAKEHLHTQWGHTLARHLAERVYPTFQDLRRFLKSKKRDIKLSGYDDLDRYDLGRILSLDDFEGRDSVVLNNAFPYLNFRRRSFLRRVTDERGRLRLVPEIARLTLTTANYSLERAHLVWLVERKGSQCALRPAVGGSHAKRAVAREVAEKWRTDKGRLCFQTSLDNLLAMVEHGEVVPSFPALSYMYEAKRPMARAELQLDPVECYLVGAVLGRGCTGGQLKDVLRFYGVSTTGDKATLLRKISKLAADHYHERCEEMDGFFCERRFVRIDKAPSRAQAFPLLEDARVLRNVLLTAYILRHLRGNAILDPGHENTTYSVQDLMLALLDGRVTLTGAFLPVQ